MGAYENKPKNRPKKGGFKKSGLSARLRVTNCMYAVQFQNSVCTLKELFDVTIVLNMLEGLNLKCVNNYIGREPI